MKSIITLFTVSIVFGCSLAYATIIHIPDDYPTIQAGIDIASDWDTVLVADGTYLENVNFLGKVLLLTSENGPEYTAIKIHTTGVPVVTFDSGEGRNSVLSGFTIDGDSSYWGILCSSASPTIYNNVIKNHEAGIMVNGGGPLIRKNDICFCDHSDIAPHLSGGINLHSSGAVIDSNIIHHNEANVAAAMSINYCDNIIIERNLIFSNIASGYIGGVVLNNSNHIDFINNTLVQNSTQNLDLASITYHHCSDVVIINNIVSFNGEWGICDYGNNSGIAYDYNDIYGNEMGDYLGIEPGSNDISANPLFVGGEPFDFRLQAGSPCIDAGDPESPPDPDGSIADMGAYYFGTVLTSAIDIADTYGENGQPVDIPLIATGLTENEIAGVELHVGYDPECLEYASFSSDYLTDPLVNVADGVINILWEDYEYPVTLPDSSSVIDLQFTILGQIGDVCLLEWTGYNELVDPLGEPIDGVSWDNGSVTVIEFHSIAGNVVYYDLLTPVAEVTIQLSGDHNLSTITDDSGAYIFETLFPGSFALCPSRTDDDAGVTITDIVNIRRHIVRLETFDTPYKLLAADVNISGTVSVADVIKLRRYLADLDDLPSGNWAFINSSFVINDDNWQSAPDCIDFDLWDADLTDSSFVGVRMGDVDYSWAGDRRGMPRPKTGGSIELSLEDCLGVPGDIVKMPVNVAGFKDVAGFELHLEYRPEEVRCLGLETESMNQPTTNIAEGEIHFVWEDIFHAVTLNDGEEALSLLFEILDGAPDTMIVSVLSTHIADIGGADYDIVATDGYIYQQYPTKHGDAYSLPESFNLRETYPNPFNARANIEFDIPEATYVTLAIYDLLGREIEILVDRFCLPGYHRATWDAGARPSGLYFVRLQAGEYNADRKMLLIK